MVSDSQGQLSLRQVKVEKGWIFKIKKLNLVNYYKRLFIQLEVLFDLFEC